MTAKFLNSPREVDGVDGFTNENFCAQRKYDGVRMALVWGRGGISAITKGGKKVKVPDSVQDVELPTGTALDGELVAESWEGALAALNLGRGGQWKCFDLISRMEGRLCPADIQDRIGWITRYTPFDPISIEPVGSAWEKACADSWEGIVIRPVHGGYSSRCYKIKPPRELVAIAHRGHLFVTIAGRPHAIAVCSPDLSGKVVIAVEGVTAHLKVRAPRFLRTAPDDASVDISQLDSLRFTSAPPSHQPSPHRTT